MESDPEHNEASELRSQVSLLPVSKSTSWSCDGVPTEIDAKYPPYEMLFVIVSVYVSDRL